MFDNLFKTNQTTAKTTQTGSMFSSLFAKKEEITPFQTVVKLQGGGVYKKGATPEELIKTERTDYGGLPTKKGYERADIVPVSLGGVNAAPENITYEPYSLTEKVKDFANKVYNSKLFSVIFNDTKNKINVLKQVAGTDILPKAISTPIKQITAKEYIPQTETDKYLKEEILPAYKSGKMSLQEARAKTVSFLKTEQEGIKQGTMANLPSAVGKTIKDTVIGVFSPVLSPEKLKSGQVIEDIGTLVSLPFTAITAAQKGLGAAVTQGAQKLTGKGNETFSESYKKSPTIGGVISEGIESLFQPKTTGGFFVPEFIGAISDVGVGAVLLGALGKGLLTKTNTIKISPEQINGKTTIPQSHVDLVTKVFKGAPKEVVENLKQNGVEFKITSPELGAKGLVGELIGGGAPEKQLNVKIPNYKKTITSAVIEPKTPFQLIAKKSKTGEVPSIEIPKEPTTPFSQIHEQLQAEKAKEVKPTEDPLIQEAKKYKTTVNIQDKNDLEYLRRILSEDNIKDIQSGKMVNFRGTPYEDIAKVNLISETPKTIEQQLAGKIKEVKLKSDTFYHGTSAENARGIMESGFKRGSELPEETFRGGGYGKMQNSISLTETPKDASRFSTLSKNGEIIEAKLKPNSKVVSIEGVEDAVELEDYISYLKKQKVDAVYIGGGEKELVVINPKAITPTKSQLTDIWNKAQSLTKQPESARVKSEPLKPQEGGKTSEISHTGDVSEFQSRVFDRLKAERPELEGELGAEKVNLENDAKKAVDLISTDKQKAYDIAMGKETSNEVTSTAVNIALAEKALQDGNTKLYSDLVINRSLAQTRRGQEIVAEKGSVTDNSTSKYVKELISARLDNLGKDYLSDLKGNIKKQSPKKRAIEKIDKGVSELETKIKNKKLDTKTALDLLDKLTCLT